MSEGVVVACPSCGKKLKCRAELIGKRAKCACGETFPVPRPGAAGPVAAGRGGAAGAVSKATPKDVKSLREQSAAQEAKAALIKRGIIGLVVLVLAVGAVFAVREFGAKTATPSLGEDAKVEELKSDFGGEEAGKWLKGHSGRMFSGMTQSQAEGYIDKWYKMGVTNVLAFGGVMTMNVALELPADQAKRDEVFKWGNGWNAESDVPPAKDVGQKYFLVRLRL